VWGSLYPSFLQQHGPYAVVKISEGPGFHVIRISNTAGRVRVRVRVRVSRLVVAN